MRNIFLPCAIEHWPFDLVNSVSADFHTPEPEDAIFWDGDTVIDHVGNLFTDTLCGNRRAVGNVFLESGTC